MHIINKITTLPFLGLFSENVLLVDIHINVKFLYNNCENTHFVIPGELYSQCQGPESL